MRILIFAIALMLGQTAMATLCKNDPNGFGFGSCGRVGDKIVISTPGIVIAGDWYSLAGVAADSTGKPPSESDQDSGKVTAIGDQICRIYGAGPSVNIDFDSGIYESAAFLKTDSSFGSIGLAEGTVIAQITCSVK